MYIIYCKDQRGYVAKSGLHSSYTNQINNVRIFKTREEAEGNRCPENERIVPLEDLIERRR